MCPAEKGPADCINNLCYCMTGYCTHCPSSAEPYCVARVIGKTCQRQTDCRDFGSGTTICSSGACVCVWNYRYDPFTSKCEKGWVPPAMPFDMTQQGVPGMVPTQMPFLAEDGTPRNFSMANMGRLVLANFKAPKDQQTSTVINGEAVLAFVAAAVTAVVALVLLVRRNSKGPVKEEDAQYQQL
eukprot:gnl/MRDRNA2_/MRDRNA2_133948_c0_seq1.p1 gnl/MRDRNA2_/MRDRNA2_133948_c0~~gnl/MRDRNA2_/MRDRNA2_133948_c0_seq1.p1  ORF type:complete len:213 (+),score=19.37 gnl/MRDRNA2_/MRDRNA2_133948_c0_seq1:88-639(+)